MSDTLIKVASAQVAPVFLDLAASVDKACGLIADAAQNGAKLIVFPEAFLPAYPCWVWKVPSGDKATLDALYTELLENSVSIPSPAVDKLCRAAKLAKITVAMGINERNDDASRASIFNTLLYIGENGEILGRHRKLVPTAGERLVWTGGDGSTLGTHDLPFGRVGGLICWENYMPLARYAMFAGGTQIYVAPTWDRGEPWLSTIRHIAKEGGVFVISACIPLRVADIPDRYGFKQLYAGGDEWINAGDSAIVNPEGKIIAGPVNRAEEIVYAELDMRQSMGPRWKLDIAGHYARPDVFTFIVNRDPQHIME
ncbi:MAG TPA: carbon-nitrogen hydrolase family protein [bacterium]|jgi:nitrilase